MKSASTDAPRAVHPRVVDLYAEASISQLLATIDLVVPPGYSGGFAASWSLGRIFSVGLQGRYAGFPRDDHFDEPELHENGTRRHFLTLGPTFTLRPPISGRARRHVDPYFQLGLDLLMERDVLVEKATGEVMDRTTIWGLNASAGFGLDIAIGERFGIGPLASIAWGISGQEGLIGSSWPMVFYSLRGRFTLPQPR